MGGATTTTCERTDVIKGNKVTKKLPIGGTAYPETDGVVYVTAGAAGRSLYAFSAPLSYEGNEHDVDSVASFVNVKGGKQNETVAWSRVRHRASFAVHRASARW